MVYDPAEVFIWVLSGTVMAVVLTGACPAMREALALGRECGLVYGVMWEAAWHDQRGRCGGTTVLSHTALADLCHLGKSTVCRAVDLLLDDGLIQYLHLVPTRQGSWKRRYRVTHPSELAAQREAIEVMGEWLLPSERAKRARATWSKGSDSFEEESYGVEGDVFDECRAS